MSEFNLQEALSALSSDASSFPIPSELDMSSFSLSEVDAHLSSAIDSVTSDPDSLIHSSPTTFDVFCSVLKYTDNPSESGIVFTKLLDVIMSGLKIHTHGVLQMMGGAGLAEEDMDAPMVHKQPLEMWAFLMQWFVTVADKKDNKLAAESARVPGRGAKGKKGGKAGTSQSASSAFIMADHIPFLASGMISTLELPTSRLWRSTSERETFIACFTRPAYQLLETESYLKTREVRMGIFEVICRCIKFHGHAFGAQTSIIQSLTYFEHLSEPMAEILALLEKEMAMPQVGEEVLREVGNRPFSHTDAKGPRSFGRFLVKLAEETPRMVMRQMPVLKTQLDSEAHPMRMSIIEIIGIIILDLFKSDEGDVEQKEKEIERYYGLLMERLLDLNSWVRCKALQTLFKLCNEIRIPPKQRAQITALAIRTLEDKTSSARKYAIQLLTKLVETHPFGMHPKGEKRVGYLDIEAWQEGYDDVCARLEQVDAAELAQARRDAGLPEEDEDEEDADAQDAEEGDDSQGSKRTSKHGQADDEDDESETPRPKEKKKKQPRISAADIAAVASDPNPIALNPQEIAAHRALQAHFRDALIFMNQIEGATPTLCELLVSTAKTEVLESIRFFRTAKDFQMASAEKGIKTMLHLIWTKDNASTTAVATGGQTGQSVPQAEEMDGKGVRATLIETYRALYFEPNPELPPQLQIKEIAKNMIELTYDATLAELTSLEELMRTTMNDGGVLPDVVEFLWQIYSTSKNLENRQRQGAIIILGMLGLARREVVTEGVDALLRIGLGPLGMNDLTLARYTCIALQRLGGSVKKVKGSLNDKTMRLPMDNPIFVKLGEMIENAPRSPLWFGMAEQAINTIYLLGEQPDQLCSTLIKSLTARVLSKPSSSNSLPNDDTATPADEELPETPAPGSTAHSSPTKDSDGGDKGGSFALAQLVFTVGHVAIKHIVYLELVEREFKRRKDETAKEKAAAKEKDGNDLDAVAGNAEDDIGDLISGIREKELLYGDKSLLAIYGPMVAHICASPKRYRSHVLRQAATLALTKLMCVSAQYCESHLLLLFKILETSKDPIVRSNIVIALGDIAVCWGSMIDDNSERLYQGLADSSLIVKKNTLMVLTHLILNGMIKVKGQLGEMAKCLEDPDKRISDLAKLFFTELSTKDNALYNNLQDVISHLSIGKHAVDEETFERTMRFIFTFIEKDKQAEAIVEKLCQRFRLATDERQWRDISFCLSLLPFKSERSMKKLIEGLPFYQDKLHEETVFRRFSDILAKARANKNSNKPETELKEFEAILLEHQAQGLEEQALEADVARKTKAAKRKATKRDQASTAKTGGGRAGARRGGRRKAVESDEDDDDGDWD